MSVTFSAYDKVDIINFLKDQVKDGQVKTDDEDITKSSYSDRMPGEHGKAIALIEAESIADVQGVMKAARKFHIPVVTQNRFTSTVIGADAVDDSFILSTVKMNKIKEINVDDAYAVVEPGVVNADLDAAAREHDLFYAPDPASKPLSGIDGNLHPTVTWAENTPAPASVDEVLRKMFKKALELDGTISGEHAVGMLKSQWNNVELGESVDWVQHQIKSLFDPMNLLNPKRKID